MGHTWGTAGTLGLLILLSGCGLLLDANPHGAASDGGVTPGDSARLDSDQRDGAPRDSGLVDATLLDGSPTDGSATDGCPGFCGTESHVRDRLFRRHRLLG